MNAADRAAIAHVSCAAPIAYSVAGAAAATGLGETVIRDALKDGSIPKHYLNTKPIILASDLLAWVTGLPSTPSPKP